VTKSWGFTRTHGKSTHRHVEITVELRDDEGHLGAYAEDSYYYGDLPKEQAIDLARAVLAKFDQSLFPVGAHARVVDGAMCGIDGFIVGTVREDGYVILRCRDGISLQPPRFVRVGP
jgi:hypothetical protein